MQLFFPVCHEKHMYLICVDFKNGSFKVIDNSSLGADFATRYYGIPEQIVSIFYQFCSHVNL